MLLIKTFGKSCFYIIVMVNVITVSCEYLSYVKKKYSALSSTLNANLKNAAEVLVLNNLWTADWDELKEQGWTYLPYISEKFDSNRCTPTFTIQETDYNNNSGRVSTKNVATDFTMELFIIKGDIYFYFCEENNIDTSNCYYIRFHDQIRITAGYCECSKRVLYWNDRCTYNQTKRASRLFFPINILIKKVNNKFTVEDIHGYEFITFKNKEMRYHIKTMQISTRSNKLSVFWKLRGVNSFHINETKQTEFTELIKPISDSICISGFVRMCPDCTIKFEIKNKNDEILGKKEFSSQDLVWQKIEFYQKGITSKVKLKIFTIKSKWENNPFWIIYNIKQCALEVPEKISNLSVAAVSSSEISLKWKFGNINTNFSRYVLRYKILYSSEDNANNVSNYSIVKLNEKEISSDYITLSGLAPSTLYEISVAAENTTYQSFFIKIQVYTLPSENILETKLILVTLLPLILMVLVAILIMEFRRRNKQPRQCDTLKNVEPKTTKHSNFQLRTEVSPANVALDFSKNLQFMVKNKKLKNQHQNLLKLFPHAYEKIKGTLDYENLDLNFKNNCQISKAYVIYDFPKPHQAGSFWDVIWEKKIENIVLLDNLRFQESYWPALNMNSIYGNLSVKCVWEKKFPEYEFRKFIIMSVKRVRTINHFRFTAWLNQDLPDHLTCLRFFRKISQIQMKPETPLLFQSRMGLKATGFAMLCDMSMRIAEKDQNVDVFRTALQLAEYSTKLVDDYECYELAHFVILECLLASDVDIDVDFNFQDSNVKLLFTEDKFQKYLTYMKETKWIDLNREIRRESYLYFCVGGPQYTGATMLKPCYPRAEINATLQSFGGITIQSPNSKKIVLIRQPTSKEVKLFWKIVTEIKILQIVVLNKIEDPENRLWIRKNDYVSLENTSTKKLHNYEWINTTLVHGEKETKNIEIFEIQNWFSRSFCPPNVSDFVDFCLKTYNRTKNSQPMLVICRDGTTASSLYIAMYYIVAKIQKEKKLDVCTSTRLVRKYCAKFTENKEQLKFLWKTAEECVNQHSLYELC